MSFFKKIFSSSSKKKEETDSNEEELNLPIDQSFVHHFTQKKGKFLYCNHIEEVQQYLSEILQENVWEDVLCNDKDLKKMLLTSGANSTSKQQYNQPFFTTCEHLIAKDGSILFSSNQLSEKKLQELPIHFIVFAKTSQIVINSDQALMSIKNKNKKNIPSNISATKCYDPNKKEEDFMDYGNNNSKSLYLLLLEDL
ncbi:MAG: LUD domain-containing protein [Flavobacteriaceae bacterium]